MNLLKEAILINVCWLYTIDNNRKKTITSALYVLPLLKPVYTPEVIVSFMPLYYFLIRASGVKMQVDGAIVRNAGFYTGRTVEAVNEETAQEELWKAVDMDAKINSVVKNMAPDDPPVMFYIENCRKVTTPLDMGMAFFMNE
jgi:hypothetical protein